MDSEYWMNIQQIVALLDEWYHTIRKYAKTQSVYSEDYFQEEKINIENVSFKLKELYDGFRYISYNPRVHALLIKFDNLKDAKQLAQHIIDISDNFNFFDDIDTPLGATILMQSIREDGFYNV